MSSTDDNNDLATTTPRSSSSGGANHADTDYWYFDKLREEQANEVTKEGSRVVRYNSTLRLAHFLTSQTLTRENAAHPFLVSVFVASGVAIKHLNERYSPVVPELPNRLASCDMHFTYTVGDNQRNPSVAVSRVLDAFHGDHSLQHPHPLAVSGAGLSYITRFQSIVTSALETPQISCCNDARDLDRSALRPLFGRIYPAFPRAGAKAIVDFLLYRNVFHVGVIHKDDNLGREQASLLGQFAVEAGIKMVFAELNTENAREAVQFVSQQGHFRYFVGIFFSDELLDVLLAAEEEGIVGPGYTWIFGQNQDQVAGGQFVAEKNVDGYESKLEKLLEGSAVIIADIPNNPKFTKMMEFVKTDEAFQKHYQSRNMDQDFLQGFNYSAVSFNSIYGELAYDTMMALGIAACETTTDDFFTGPDYYENILQTKFWGSTGEVGFDYATGNRDSKDTAYFVYNVLSAQHIGDRTFTTQVHLAEKIALGKTLVINDFIYADGTTDTPPSLPPPEYDVHTIGSSLRLVGILLGSLVFLVSVFCTAFIVKHRNTATVRIAQPFFLFMLTFGTCSMALSIILLSMESPFDALTDQTLHRSCNAVPWFFCLGFATAYSGLRGKLKRIFNLIESAARFRRRTLLVSDMMPSYSLLLAANAIILTFVTIVAPWKWRLVPDEDDVDQYGRVTSFRGMCAPLEEDRLVNDCCVLALLLLNSLAIVHANYYTYLTRNFPDELSESTQLAWAMASLLEAILIGGPVLLLVNADPAATFVVKVILMTIVCLSVLMPVISVSGSFKSHQTVEEDGRVIQQALKSSVDSYRYHSTGGGGGGGGRSTSFQLPKKSQPRSGRFHSTWRASSKGLVEVSKSATFTTETSQTNTRIETRFASQHVV